MSAFMVGKDHIDALVSVALHGPTDGVGKWEGPRWAAHDPRVTDWQAQEWRQCALQGPFTPDRLGEMLWTENERSVEARYPSDHAEMLSIDYCLGYAYTPVPIKCRLTLAAAFSAIACLSYQSCEHDEWGDSEAYRFLDALKSSLVNALPGYSEAPWEVDFARDTAMSLERAIAAAEPAAAPRIGRDETIKAIRVALKRRTGRAWSVTGGKGTGWGWIHVTAPPRRRTGVHVKREGQKDRYGHDLYELVDSGVPQEFGYMTPDDVETLRVALDLERVHYQGVSIAASSDHYAEYVARAEGLKPAAHGVQYWD
jgi:hypothetical protein